MKEVWEGTHDMVECFSIRLQCAKPIPKCFTTEQSTVKASLFVF